jgi:hypothetical protein
MDKHYIYNYEKINYIVSKLKPTLLELTPNIVYKDQKHSLCYDQVLISVKYNKLQNYRKRVKQWIDLLVGTNKNIYLLEVLLQEIDECITILEALKQVDTITFQQLALLDIELVLE